MPEDNYWPRALRRIISRRSLLRGGTLAGLGLASLPTAACSKTRPAKTVATPTPVAAMKTKAARVSGGEAVIRALKAEGVDVLFGLPGIHALPIYDALYHHPEIRHIAVRHEQTAAYMADAYARVTGKPGVFITTTGPGAANTIAAMGTSYNDSIPVLNIMSQISTDLVDKGRGALHEAKDQLGVFKACTRWAARVSKQEDVPGAIHEAFVRMRVQHPGPTAIEFCTDILLDAADINLPEEDAQYERAKGDPSKVKQAADMLLSARSPVLWVGGGAVMSGAFDEIRKLAELLKAPVFTTNKGKGTLDEDHPLSVGTRSAEPLVRQLIRDADVMLAVGTRFSGNSTAQWTIDPPKQLIQIDIDESQIGRIYPASIGLSGDAKVVLGQLIESLDGATPGRTSPEARVAEIKRQSVAGMRRAGSKEMEVFGIIRESLPRNAIIVCDQTKPAYWSARSLPVYEPRSFIYPAVYGTLGYAFPAALGAKVGAPERPVVVITGDGGFQYALPEMATAIQFGINVTVLLFNDNCWGMIRDLQDSTYGGRRYANELYNPDFVGLAEDYRANGIRVNNAGELRDAIKKALSADKTALVEIPMEFGLPAPVR